MSILHQISGCNDGARLADVIFVHGLGGDAFSTWRHGADDSSSWPHWLGREFSDIGVWSLGLSTSPTAWTRVRGWVSARRPYAGHMMPLPDLALELLDQMVRRGFGQRPILFICHSLGGLLVKQVLRTAATATAARTKLVAEQTRAVLFLATPHTGVPLASLLDSFRAVFGTTVSIEDLRAHDAHRHELFDWYRNHAPGLDIETLTFYERQGSHGVRPIIEPALAHPGAGDQPVGLEEDHLSIARPRDMNYRVCVAVRGMLHRHVIATSPVPPVQLRSPSTALTGTSRESITRLDAAATGNKDTRRIPHELPPAARQFFGRQAEVKQLVKRLRGAKNSAVVGAPGLGKTAVAAEAIRQVAGDTPVALAASPFPDGVAYLDLHAVRGQADLAWHALANQMAGAGFMQNSPARDRAREVCRARRILVVVDNGEEADGNDGRCAIAELFSVLSLENRWLLLTRLSTQATLIESVELKKPLHPDDAARFLDSLTLRRVTTVVRERVLELLEGHPLALTWAGGLLAGDGEDPGRLVADWQSERLPHLSDATQAEHTLKWLFQRSMRGLDDSAQQALAAAGLLAQAPFPLTAIRAGLGGSGPDDEQAVRNALKALIQRGLLRRSVDADHWQFAHVLGYRFARKETGSDPALRESLGRWLHEHLAVALAANASGNGPLSLGRGLQHAAALLQADDDQRLWKPLANYALYDASDRLVELGRWTLVSSALVAVAGWLERFAPDKSQEPQWLRERSVLRNRQGDVLMAQGDGREALAAYRQGLAIAEALAARDPASTQCQRDLLVSHTKIGDVSEAIGDAPAALAAFRQCLAIAEALTARDPGDTEWQMDVALSCARLGAFDQGLDAAARRDYLLRGRQVLLQLKADGRLPPGRDLIGWFAQQLGRLGPGSE